jgi:hypothetical protein
MNHSVTSRDRPSPGLHAGAVSLLRLLDLYGESHRAELDELWAAPGTDYLALFADDTGRDCAILPVGSAHEYRNLDTVLGLNIEGLHAVCYTPARDMVRPVEAPPAVVITELAEPEWSAYKEEFPELAKELIAALLAAAPGSEPVRAAMRHLATRLRDVARHETELVRREHYVHEAEENLNTRAEAHIVRHVELEQREHEIDAARRDMERRSGNTPPPFDLAPAFARTPAVSARRTI